jgi:hypothetical protein
MVSEARPPVYAMLFCPAGGRMSTKKRKAGTDFGASTGGVHRADAAELRRLNVGCLSRRRSSAASAKRTTAPGKQAQASATATEHRGETGSARPSAWTPLQRGGRASDFGASTGGVHRAEMAWLSSANPVVSALRMAMPSRQKEQRPRGRRCRQPQPRRNVAARWSRTARPPWYEGCSAAGADESTKKRKAGADFGAWAGGVHRAARPTIWAVDGGRLSAAQIVGLAAKRTTAPGAHAQATSAATDHRGKTVSALGLPQE